MGLGLDNLSSEEESPPTTPGSLNGDEGSAEEDNVPNITPGGDNGNGSGPLTLYEGNESDPRRIINGGGELILHTRPEDRHDQEFHDLPELTTEERGRIRELTYESDAIMIRGIANKPTWIACSLLHRPGIILSWKQCCARAYREGACSNPNCNFYHGEPGEIFVYNAKGPECRRYHGTPSRYCFGFANPANRIAFENRNVDKKMSLFTKRFDPASAEIERQLAEERRDLEKKQEIHAERLRIREAYKELKAAEEVKEEAVKIKGPDLMMRFIQHCPAAMVINEAMLHQLFGPQLQEHHLQMEEQADLFTKEGDQRTWFQVLNALYSERLSFNLLTLKENAIKAMRCPSIKGEAQCNKSLDVTAYLQGKRGEDIPFVCLHCMGMICCSYQCAKNAGHLGLTSVCRPHPAWLPKEE